MFRCPTVSAGALADDNITVTVNGNNVSFVEITPFIENDHTLVPMREIFEALGADVQWDNETRTVISQIANQFNTLFD